MEAGLKKQFSQLATWDRSQLMARVGNREDRIELLIEMYLGDAQPQLEKLGQAVSALDYAAASYTAHRIKGSTANLGAEKVSALCEQLETAARNSNGKELKAYWPLFVSAHDEFEQALKNSK